VPNRQRWRDTVVGFRALHSCSIVLGSILDWYATRLRLPCWGVLWRLIFWWVVITTVNFLPRIFRQLSSSTGAHGRPRVFLDLSVQRRFSGVFLTLYGAADWFCDMEGTGVTTDRLLSVEGIRTTLPLTGCHALTRLPHSSLCSLPLLIAHVTALGISLKVQLGVIHGLLLCLCGLVTASLRADHVFFARRKWANISMMRFWLKLLANLYHKVFNPDPVGCGSHN